MKSRDPDIGDLVWVMHRGEGSAAQVRIVSAVGALKWRVARPGAEETMTVARSVCFARESEAWRALQDAAEKDISEARHRMERAARDVEQYKHRRAQAMLRESGWEP